MSEENKTLHPQDETPAAAAEPTAAETPETETPETETAAAQAPDTASTAAETPGGEPEKKAARRGKKKKSEAEMTEEEKKEAEKKKRNKPKNTKQSAKRLLGYIGEHKAKLVLVAFLVIGSTAVSVLSALLIRPIYATVQSVLLGETTDGDAAIAKIDESGMTAIKNARSSADIDARLCFLLN